MVRSSFWLLVLLAAAPAAAQEAATPTVSSIVVFGTVVDDCTIPVAGARVLLLPARATEPSGRDAAATVVASAVTDTQGEFRIEHAPPGRYLLFVPAVGMLQDAYVRGGYARAYYPAADTAANAVPIDVRADRELPPLTVTVAAVGTQTVSGGVASGSALPPSRELVMIQRDMPGIEVFRGTLGFDGRFTIGGVPAGEYVVLAPPALRATVRVLDADVAGVVLAPDANGAR